LAVVVTGWPLTGTSRVARSMVRPSNSSRVDGVDGAGRTRRRTVAIRAAISAGEKGFTT